MSTKLVGCHIIDTIRKAYQLIVGHYQVQGISFIVLTTMSNF